MASRLKEYTYNGFTYKFDEAHAKRIGAKLVEKKAPAAKAQAAPKNKAAKPAANKVAPVATPASDESDNGAPATSDPS